MEKFINLKQLKVVKTGTSTANGSAGLTLTDSAATFTQSILPNAIVWDRTTNAGTGGEMYTVASVDSDTQLQQFGSFYTPKSGFQRILMLTNVQSAMCRRKLLIQQNLEFLC